MDLSPKSLGRGGGVVLVVAGGLVALVGAAMLSSTDERGVDRFGNAAGGPVQIAVLMLGVVLLLLAIRSAPRSTVDCLEVATETDRTTATSAMS